MSHPYVPILINSLLGLLGLCTRAQSPLSLLTVRAVDLYFCTLGAYTLQRHNTENSKQIFQEKELHGLSPNFHIHVSVSDLYITTIFLPILQQENMWTDPGNI